MNALQCITTRRSVPSRLLTAPGPDDATLRMLVDAALVVPDHGKLSPFRILRIAGAARLALGDFLADLTQRRDPAAEVAVVEKDRGRFAHAPEILAVLACITPGHKIPEQEQLLSAGAVCLNLLHGAQTLGFGAQWLTGWPAYDLEVARYLGLNSHEKIVGFVHIGTASGALPERARPTAASKMTDWLPPA